MTLFRQKSSHRDALPGRRSALLQAQKKAAGTDRAAQRFIAAYKRGTTLPGATKPRLYAADQRALQSATTREKLHHLANVRQKLIALLVMSLVTGFAIVCFMFQFAASVTITTTESHDVGLMRLYHDSVEDYYQQHPIERFVPTLDRAQLQQFITQKHPEIESIILNNTSLTGRVSYVVSLRIPVVSWQIGQKRFYVDKNGVPFERAVSTEPGVKIVDRSGVAYTPGTAFASERFMGFVGKVVAQAQSSGMVVENVTIPAGTSRQVELYAKGIPYIIMSIDRPAAAQLEDARRAAAYFDANGVHPQYIDVRIKGRAYYRD